MASHPDIRHRPDIVIRGFDGAGTHLLIDVKTLDAAGATHIRTDHTDRLRLKAHEAIATKSKEKEYGELPSGMRLVIVAISSFGSFGADALPFLAELSLRMADSLPSALLGEATWAAPRLSTFARMALTCAVRRGLAQTVYRHWIRTDEIPDAPADGGGDDDEAPPPLALPPPQQEQPPQQEPPPLPLFHHQPPAGAPGPVPLLLGPPAAGSGAPHEAVAAHMFS